MGASRRLAGVAALTLAAALAPGCGDTTTSTVTTTAPPVTTTAPSVTTTAPTTTSPTTTSPGGGEPGALLWAARYNGPANGAEAIWNDFIQAIAVSPDGTRVFVTGGSTGAGTGFDYTTVAYDPASGEQLWEARFDGPAGLDEISSCVVVSPDGSTVVVTGGSTSATTGIDVVTIAYDAATGEQRWVDRYDGPGHANEAGGSMAVDPTGARVFVAGSSEESTPGEKSWAVIALDLATGARDWVDRYPGPDNRSTPKSVAVSPDGTTAYVTGWSEEAGGKVKDIATLAFDASSGGKRWEARYAGTGGENEGRSVAVSPDGAKLFVTGTISDPAGPGYAAISYDAATGTQRWVQRSIGPPASGAMAATPVVVSRDGARVFVTGTHATVAYDAATGAPLWSRADTATSLAVSADGAKVFVTGGSAANGSGNDYATSAYDAATGEQLWTARYDGPAKAEDVASAVAVSPSGKTVFVTGTSDGVGSGTDYATVAYRT